MNDPQYIIRETDDGCMVWEIKGSTRDKVDFFSSVYLAQQAYPQATLEALPSFADPNEPA